MSFPPPTERQARLIWLAVTGLAIAVLVALVAALIWGLGRALGLLAPVLWPLAVAGVVAYLLDPVVDWLERRGLPRTRAILMVFFVAAAVLLGVVASDAPRVVVEASQLASRVPEYTQKVQQWLHDLLAN